jgi:hypothetical protein
VNGETIRTRVAVGAFALLVAASVWAGVSTGRPSGLAYDHPAAVAVEKVLTLRYARSTDAAAYAPYFLESAIATELAATSAELTQSPIPRWQTPYVSAEGTSGVDVVVKWVASGQAAPSAIGVVFTVRETPVGWAISDAKEVAGTPPPPLGER